MKLLADSNWLIRLEKEHRHGVKGAARQLFECHPVFLNQISLAEFLSAGRTPARLKLVAQMRRLLLTWEDALVAAQCRFNRNKQGKPLSTPDALMAACAINNRMRLVTSDKDFSGVPGLDWSAHRD